MKKDRNRKNALTTVSCTSPSRVRGLQWTDHMLFHFHFKLEALITEYTSFT